MSLVAPRRVLRVSIARHVVRASVVAPRTVRVAPRAVRASVVAPRTVRASVVAPRAVRASVVAPRTVRASVVAPRAVRVSIARHVVRAALVALVACGGAVRDPAPPPTAQGDEFRERTGMLRATLARSSIALDDAKTISTCHTADTRKKCVRCEVASDMDGIDPELLDRIALVFAGYPEPLLRAMAVERVALCRELVFEGEDIGPAGVAELKARRILVGIGYLHRNDGRGVEQVVHHELFHLFDLATLGAAMTDRAWLGLLPKGFAYRGEGALDEAAPPGFVNAYATTNEIEDRASVYEFMTSEPSLCELTKRDPLVAKKVRLVGKRIAAAGGAPLLARTTCRTTAAPPKPRRGKPDLSLPKRYRDGP